MRATRLCAAIGVGLLAAIPLVAQDPTQVDPKHYKVVFENDQVRVLHITYGPNEKSIMHHHPAGVAVFLTEHRGKFTFPDGTSQERVAKAGDTIWVEAETHLPQNMGSKPMEVILVEMKSSEMGTPMRGTVVCDPPGVEHALPVEGRPNHSYVVNQTKCTWSKPWRVRGLASVKGVGTGIVEDHGGMALSSGTFVDTAENGDSAYYNYSFKTKMENGKQVISEHKWELIGGTGTMKGAKGSGTCKATAQDDGKVVYECQGTYR